MSQSVSLVTMFASQPLTQLKSQPDLLSPVLANSVVIEDLEGNYKSKDEKWSKNDSVIPNTEEFIFNSFFSFIDEPESDHQESGEYFEEDCITKDEDDIEMKEQKRQKRLSDSTVGEYFEEDIQPKDEDDTEVKENKAEKPNRCVRSMPQCPKLYDIKHCNAMYAIMCIEVKVD